MGLNSTGLQTPEVGSAPTDISPKSNPSRSNWWIWVVMIVLVVGGIWYYRGTQATAQNPPGAAGGAGADPRRGAAGMPAVPVVVAAAQHGDLPVYFNGLGTVIAHNTVTIRSRVDGAIVKVNFTEGQFVHEGDALVEIDPRPYQVALEQAEG